MKVNLVGWQKFVEKVWKILLMKSISLIGKDQIKINKLLKAKMIKIVS